MSNIVCCIIFGFFIILGMVDVIKLIMFNMFDFSKRSNENSTFDEKIDSENIEYVIRNILAQKAWAENPDKIELVLPDISEETQKILRILSKDYPHLKTENHTSAIKA